MRPLIRPLSIGIFVCSPILWTGAATAHGILGDRFFPPTIATDDPFAVDELALPTLSYTKNGGSPSSHEFDAGFEFDKEILPGLAIGVSDRYVVQKPQDQKSIKGWQNLTILTKYDFLLNEEHEFIAGVGLYSEIGGTGSAAVGASSFSTFTPALFLGKGFGDLPDSLDALKPIAVTGVLQQSFPTSSRDPNLFGWNFALEYSLPYLQQHVKDVGLPAPFNTMIPLVEFSMSTPENRGQSITTGTINPGVLYENNYFQLGIEANVPVNAHSGAHVGVTVQMWVYIDDIFPRTFGHPLFGGQP